MGKKLRRVVLRRKNSRPNELTLFQGQGVCRDVVVPVVAVSISVEEGVDDVCLVKQRPQ